MTGLIGGASGAVASKVGAIVAKKVGTSVMGRLASEAVENGVDDGLQQLASGGFDPRSAAENMIPGLGTLNRKNKGGARSPAGGGTHSYAGSGGASPGRGCHSFDARTRVLMANGTTRPIEDVNVGDKVVATDPATGKSEPKQVTQLHRNTDKDLTDLTVRDQDGKAAKVKTTWHHPFWNASKRQWTDAKDLKPGTKLLVRGKGLVTVVAVLNRLGAKEMRDLTVADLHTYYVFAGSEPVLVHNNNDMDACELDSRGRVIPSTVSRLPSGKLPSNWHHHGKKFDGRTWTDDLQQKYPDGVTFTDDGFPDFSPYATHTVRFDDPGFDGNRTSDFTQANKRAGLDGTPDGYTWHHHQDTRTMQLIPTDLHDAVRHAGGVAIARGRG